ncbi:MAG: UDP-N-acetylmuramate--alanine ligase, partial [Sphingomonas hengshuiensis]
MGLGKSYFFIGIGGSGMMPLAMILAGRGAAVAGSDRSLDQGRVPAKFAALEALSIALYPQDGSGINSSEQIVIASAAIEPTVPDRIAAERVGARLLSRAELLSQLFNDSRVRLGVAGTSGKSTVTGMIAWILHATGHQPTVMNGAVMKNFATPDAPFASALVGGGDVFVSEVDESDGSIALYHPTIAVLNNVSHDHKSMAELRVLFGDFLARAGDAGGTTIVNADDAEALALHTARARDYSGSFSIGGTPTPLNFVADNLVEEPFAISFDLIDATMPVGRVRLQVPGRHNVANA